MGEANWLLWSPEAIADLETIFGYYIDAAGERTAENIIREIAAACRLLEEHPSPAADEVRSGLRSLATHPNVIFYRLRDEVPEIIRVLDERRDIDTLFNR